MLVELRPGRRLFVDHHVAVSSAKNDERLLVVFVHGSCAHSGQWDAQVDSLHEMGISTLRYDYLGCGRSDKSNFSPGKAYHANEHYTDLVALMEQYAAEQSTNNTPSYSNISIVAHSFGCTLALRLAHERPNLINHRLILIAPPSPSTMSKPLWIFRLPTFLLGWMQSSLTDSFLEAALHPKTHIDNPTLIEQSRIASNSNAPTMFQAYYLSMPDYYENHHPSLLDSPLTSTAVTVTSTSTTPPILILISEDDRIVSVSAAKELHENLRTSRLELITEPCRHQVMEEQPEIVNRHLKEFLFEN